MGSMRFQRTPMVLAYEVVLKNRVRSCSIIHCMPNERYGGTVQLSADVELLERRMPWTNMEVSDAEVSNGLENIERNEEHQLPDSDVNLHDGSQNTSSPTKKRALKHEVEIQRRRKIGLANKGKIPWNKGRQHSQETRERIKRRTIEALRDPKVRKKMSESPCSHSEQSKAKIGFTLKKIWEERLKHKRLQAKCYFTWAGVVAEAARKGGRDQQELEWDSFEKMKSYVLMQHFQWKADKARQKEIAKRRAERVAKAKAHKMAVVVQERNEDKKVKAKKSEATLKQLEEKNKMSTISRDLKVRTKLAKFHRKQQFEGHMHRPEVPIEVQATAEKWDLEFIKRERMRQTVSLADQILAIKKERIVHTAKSVLIPSPSGSLLEENEFV